VIIAATLASRVAQDRGFSTVVVLARLFFIFLLLLHGGGGGGDGVSFITTVA
tara:strand:- start:122 stop:277 length:156 start_codon:yes stop_codon:yes gene_type:complete